MVGSGLRQPQVTSGDRGVLSRCTVWKQSQETEPGCSRQRLPQLWEPRLSPCNLHACDSGGFSFASLCRFLPVQSPVTFSVYPCLCLPLCIFKKITWAALTEAHCGPSRISFLSSRQSFEGGIGYSCRLMTHPSLHLECTEMPKPLKQETIHECTENQYISEPPLHLIVVSGINNCSVRCKV